MKLDTAFRIRLIQESAELLGATSWLNINLVLDQFGLPTSDYDIPASPYEYVLHMIRKSSDEDLYRLHSYLIDPQTPAAPMASPRRGLQLFFSHRAEHRDDIGQVARGIEALGIQAFVAHDHIQPSQEWQAEIERNLATCDALVAFIHPNFHENAWCDQEVGWVMGRQQPVLPIELGQLPLGFLSKFQAARLATTPPPAITQRIIEWVASQPALQKGFGEVLVDSLIKSRSFDQTRRLAHLLEHVPALSDADVDRLRQAADQNDQVGDCMVHKGVRGPDWVERCASKWVSAPKRAA